MDQWNPTQYEMFKDQRAKPFYDLLGLVQKMDRPQVIDLGCGTGELTRHLHDKLGAAKTLGVDSSAKMLAQSTPYQTNDVTFQKEDIAEFAPARSYDLVFSNAALQWLGDHRTLIPKILSWVSEQGQVAIQMPCNTDHPSHQIAADVAAKLFPNIFKNQTANANVLGLDTYAEMLFQSGFKKQECIIRVYGHPMASGRDVIEWTKGTALTRYQSQLSPGDFGIFLKEYERELINVIGEGPYFYAFKRMLLWGAR